MKLPESHNEITGKQLIQLAPLIFWGGEEILCKVRAFYVLSGISMFRFLLMGPNNIDRCLPYIEWVFKEKPGTKQLLPKYKGHYGPASDFDNLKMKEFHLSELYYSQVIQEENNEGAIDSLIAVLYRKGKKNYDEKRNPDGDIREDFNHNELPYHASKIAKWPNEVKQAIFLWYDACRQQLIDANPLVFKEPSNSSFQSQFDTGLYGMMRSLAGDKLGPIEKVENMYVHTAMMELGLIKEEEKYFEEQMKKQS